MLTDYHATYFAHELHRMGGNCKHRKRSIGFDVIYVNGSNNLPNLRKDDEHWKVRLIEEEFLKRMWNGEEE